MQHDAQAFGLTPMSPRNNSSPPTIPIFPCLTRDGQAMIKGLQNVKKRV